MKKFTIITLYLSIITLLGLMAFAKFGDRFYLADLLNNLDRKSVV